MAENTGYTPLPADLPEDWTPGQTVAPAGADVGLSEQHGYNYLNKQVNDAQKAVNQLHEDTGSTQTDVEQLKTDVQQLQDDVENIHGLPAGGTAGQVLGKSGEEDYQTGWQDAVGRSMAGQAVEPTQGTTVVAKDGAEIFNDYSKRTYNSSNGTVSAGNIASGEKSHAEGKRTTASGVSSHAEGMSTMATGSTSHAEGHFSEASGDYSHAEGYYTQALGTRSHAAGQGTIARNDQYVIGWYNVENTSGYQFFIVGKGMDKNSRANCFRVTNNGVYATGNYATSGADYAELFEWLDGNPDKQDRAGLFVTLQGDRIRLASPDDDYILGIVSGSPSVVGDVYDDQWQGMFLTDIFGRPVYEDVELPAELGPDGEEILPARTERRQKLNPAYDNTEKYVPRTQRPEWDAVGLVGKLVAVDDGTCVPDGWCTVGEGGRATRSEQRTKYRVMARLDETHIRVMIL